MRALLVVLGLVLCGGRCLADDLIYSYEGDVLPYPGAGWWDGTCDDPCFESLENGCLVLTWTIGGDIVNYGLRFSAPETPPPPPPPFWVEWGFASDEPLESNPLCDAYFSVDYKATFGLIYMFGDAIISQDWGTVRRGFMLGQLRTHRFETSDGAAYCVFAEGKTFLCGIGSSEDEYSTLKMTGHGGCSLAHLPTINKWDYVRYGRITYGEQIIASDPPGGFLDARAYAPLDRFTVTYDQPNYVHVDEIAANVTSSLNPSVPLSLAVAATRRRDNGPPDEVEIVLDRPVPFNATTRFTFDDGVAVNVVEFTFAPGDTDGDGDADLADFAYVANCFGPTSPCPLLGKEGETRGPCLALDVTADGMVNADDYASFFALLGP